MIRVAVFDLDGTLIPDNSFHLWLLALMRWSVLSGHWLLSMRLVWLVLKRAMRRISHLELKKQVIPLSLRVPSKVRAAFARQLYARVRPELLACMADFRQQSVTVVIATAALELYLEGFATLCGADELIGTSSQTSPDWQENLHEQKLFSLQRHFGSQLMVVEAVYSDHSDDLPLFRLARKAFVVAPSPQQWELLQASGVPCQRFL